MSTSNKPLYIQDLHVSIVGSATLLNLDSTPNTLTIALTNGNMFEGNSAETDIVIKAENKLALYFIADDTSGATSKNQFKLNWALSSRAKIKAAKAHLYLPGETVDYNQLKDQTPGWTLSQGQAPEPVDKHGKIVPNATISSLQGWELIPDKDYTLKAGESLLVVISNIITDLPDGPSLGYMYLKFKDKHNVENHFTKFGPVQKTPNIISGSRVGIGLTDPAFPLSISTKIQPKDKNAAIWNLTTFAISNENNKPLFGIAPEVIKPVKAQENSAYINYVVPNNNGHVFVAGNPGGEMKGLMWIRDPGDVTIARTLGVGGDAIVSDNLWIGNTDDSHLLTGIVPMGDEKLPTLNNGLLQIQVRNQPRILISSKTDASSVKITPNLSVEKNLNVGADLTVGANIGIGTTNPLFPLSILPGTLGSKISLWDGGDVNNMSGFGISNSQLNFIVGNKSTDHVFYAGGNNNNGSELMRIKGTRDVIIPGNLEVTGSVDSIIKIVTMSVCLGGESSKIPDLDKCTTLDNGSWRRDVNFGCTFKEKPQVIVALSAWSAYPYGSSGGTSKTGFATVNMDNNSLTTTNVTLYALVNEGDGVSSDNFVQVSIIAIGRI